MTVNIHEPSLIGTFQIPTHGEQDPNSITLHSMESTPKGLAGLQGIGRFFRDDTPGLGATVGIEGGGASMRYAGDNEICYGVSLHNTGRLHIELGGYAKWSTAEWHEHAHQLLMAARWMAYWSHVHRIPLKHATTGGVSMHRDFKPAVVAPGEYHSDPGAGFPFAYVLDLAKHQLAHGW